MGIFAKLFNKNSEEVSSKNVEDFVSLTRVYFQSVIAANLGITNIRFVPDVGNTQICSYHRLEIDACH